MKAGIWKIASARICPACVADISPYYVMRCDGDLRKTPCGRCGKETMTMAYRYTMNKRGLEIRGRLDG